MPYGRAFACRRRGFYQPSSLSLQIRIGTKFTFFPIARTTRDAIYIQGHVLRPGRYSLQQGMKLPDLIGSTKIAPELLPTMQKSSGYPPDLIRAWKVSIHRGSANPASAPKLQPLDTVRVFSRYIRASAGSLDWREVRELENTALRVKRT